MRYYDEDLATNIIVVVPLCATMYVDRACFNTHVQSRSQVFLVYSVVMTNNEGPHILI